MKFSLAFKVCNLIGRNFKSNLKLPVHKFYCGSSFAVNGYNHIFSNCNQLFVRKDVIAKERVCCIHLSNSRRALPPFVVLALRSIVKISAIVSGRLIRKWWQGLSPEEKEEVLKKIKSKKTKIVSAGTLLVGVFYLYYLANKVEDPITKRKRFMMLNQKQLYQIAEFEYRQQLRAFESLIVPTWHPLHRRVVRVTNNIILSNKDLTEIHDKIWKVTVVDRPDITNAFALPHGKIFVFTGMLNMCTNDDQLAVVLAHEIAHSILSHMAESMSKIFLMEFILLIPSIIIWSVFSDIWAIFSDRIVAALARILVHLPFSRSIEREADSVGLQLAAKSCYDVREAPVFWGKMKTLSEDAPVEWLSTHPRHESRQMELMELVPGALKTRELYHCPPLISR